MTDESQLGDVADQIVNLVQQFWEDHERPLLLSQLGAYNNGQFAQHAKEVAGSLGTYLRHQLSDRVQVLQHSTKPTIIGAIPAGEHIPVDNPDELLNRTQTQSEKPSLRFRPAFWAALFCFISPRTTEANRHYSRDSALRH